MRKNISAVIPYAIVLAADFYLLPWLIRNTGTAMFLLLFVIPMISFFCAVVYGFHRGFDFLLPAMVMILFAPTIFIFYNFSAWPYLIAYGVIALMGIGIGSIFHKR